MKLTTGKVIVHGSGIVGAWKRIFYNKTDYNLLLYPILFFLCLHAYSSKPHAYRQKLHIYKLRYDTYRGFITFTGFNSLKTHRPALCYGDQPCINTPFYQK